MRFMPDAPRFTDDSVSCNDGRDDDDDVRGKADECPGTRIVNGRERERRWAVWNGTVGNG